MEQDNAYEDIKKKKMSPLFFGKLCQSIFILILEFKSVGMYEKLWFVIKIWIVSFFNSESLFESYFNIMYSSNTPEYRLLEF